MRRAGWVAVALLAGCTAARMERRRDPNAAALAEAAGLWRKRAEPGGLDRATAAYAAILGRDARETRAMAGLARARWTAGLVAAQADPAGPAALAQWEAGRAVAFQCLLEDPGFAEVSRRAGDRVDARVAAGLGADMAGCVTWAAANAVAWVAARGPGALVELGEARALGARAAELDPAQPAARWALGTAWALGAEREPRAAARGELGAAIAAAPTCAFYRLEAVDRFPDLRDALLGAWTPPADAECAFENEVLAGRLERMRPSPAAPG